MKFSVYNTMSRRVEPFEPLEPGKVQMYTCGPTVYNYAHIGNFRAYMFEDLLRRYLKYLGYEMTQVMNLTDVDDKTIRGSIEKKQALNEYTAIYKAAFFDDLKALRVEPAEHYPAATDHVGEMIKLIRILEEKGYAYRSEDGSVYFSIAKFPEYGKLAHLDMAGLQAGARVAQDEYDKENMADFALWKGWTEADGDVFWNSPWGKGRPGWHIECSAMSMKYLGESFDIHTGGVDNIFPHHEDEIAQSEAVTGKPFSKYWMHCAHLVVDGKKMSKSEGNFYTLREILEKGYSGREIRYVLLATHYRQSLNFSFDALQGARSALGRLDEFRARVLKLAGGAAVSEQVPEWIAQFRQDFEEALNDDLNISRALGVLFDGVHAGNRLMDGDALSAGDAACLKKLLADVDAVLGVLEPEQEQVPEDVEALAAARQAARAAKDFAEADRLRDELAAQGWLIKDTPDGPMLKRK